MTRHAPNPMRPLALLLAGAGLALNAGAARVGDVVSVDAPAVAAQSSGTWSAADYASARAVTPTVGFLPAQAFDYNAAVSTAATTPVVSSSPALPPTLGARGLQQILPFTSSVDTSGGITPSAVGTGAIQFTSSRVAATATCNTSTRPTFLGRTTTMAEGTCRTRHWCSFVPSFSLPASTRLVT